MNVGGETSTKRETDPIEAEHTEHVNSLNGGDNDMMRRLWQGLKAN